MLRIDKQQGLIALGRFKSCVRTSLLLCGGYECQEKEGTFMIAFPQPRAAVEWALTLQLALLRYTLLHCQYMSALFIHLWLLQRCEHELLLLFA